MSMLRWSDRPDEEANLFNPAFSALLIRGACGGYRSVAKSPLPFSLSFLVLPIALHGPTRKALPTSTKTLMSSWVVSNPEVVAFFGKRARDATDITREAILFGGGQGWLTFEGTGLVPGKTKLRVDPDNLATSTAEIQSCHAAARMIGKWLAGAGSESTVMSLWGVSP